MIRIDVLYEQINYKAHGCGHVRLLGPFSHPRNEGRLLMRAGQSFQPGADAVIVERFWRPHSITLAEAGSLIRRIREAGSTFIYTLDDNLIDMEITRHDRQGIPMRLSAVAHLFARGRRDHRLDGAAAAADGAAQCASHRRGECHR